jgi:multidrug resistance efflux pump
MRTALLHLLVLSGILGVLSNQQCLAADPAKQKDDKPPATGDVDNQQVKDIQNLVALAEKQVATRRALAKVAEAQMKIAEAKVTALKSKLTAAEAALSSADVELQRIKELADKAVASQVELARAEAARKAAIALRDEAQANIQVGEGEVKLEAARHDVALAELDEAELRLKQLRERLK